MATPGGTLQGQLSVPRPAGRVIPAAVMVLAFGLLLGVTLANITVPPVPLVAAVGLGLLGLLILAVARYDAAVILGIALLGFVFVEPAPPDAVLAVVMLVALLTGRFDLARVPGWVALLLGALLALNAVSLVGAVDAEGAGRFLATTVFVVLLAVWLAGYVDSIRRAQGVLLAYLGAALISAALGIAALLLPIPGRGTLLYHGCCRAEGMFKDPNVFGPFLVPAVLILLEELLTPRLFAGRRGWKLAAIVVLCIGVLVSYSRAAWFDLVIALVVLLLVLVLRRGGGRSAAALLATVVLLAGAAGAYLAATGSEGFLRERATVQAYDSSRFNAQRAGIRLAEDHPLGVGPGQFDVRELISAHSIYVRVLAEQGVLGFVVLASLLLGTLALGFDNAVAGRSTYGIGSAALLAAWCGLLANSFFVDTLHWRHLWVIAALIWAGAMRGYRSALT
jgi:O-antigen ligase